MEHIEVVEQLNKFLQDINEAEDFDSAKNLWFQVSIVIESTEVIHSFCNKRINSFKKYQKSSAFKNDIKKIKHLLSEDDLNYMNESRLPILPSLVDIRDIGDSQNVGLWEFYLLSIVHSSLEQTIDRMMQCNFDDRINYLDYFLFDTRSFPLLDEFVKLELLKIITNKVLKDVINFVSNESSEAHKSNSENHSDLKEKDRVLKNFIDEGVAQGQFTFTYIEVEKVLNIKTRKKNKDPRKNVFGYISNMRTKCHYDIQHNSTRDDFTIIRT